MRCLRFSLASLLMLLLVALLTDIADWQHADLHVWSLGEAVGHSVPAAEPTVQHILAGVLSLVLLTLPASPVLQMELCPWRIAMQLRDGKRVGDLCRASVGQLRWRRGL